MTTPTDVQALARKRYVDQQLLARRAVLAARKLWAQIDPAAIRASWAASVGPAVLNLVTQAQTEAASSADAAVTSLLQAQGVSDVPTATVVASTLAGVASDGRDLLSLLELSNRAALRQVAAGRSVAQALATGRQWLDMTVGTQVADAGRVADGIAVTTTPTVEWVRMLNPPSCSRCVLLAGKVYKWNQGFERHPRCDCRHIPVTEATADDVRTDPKRYFDSLTAKEQNRVFTNAGAQAIRDGADISQVVNARRGMFTASGRKLTHSAVRLYGSRGVRLMPEQIYRDARGNREEAIRLLYRFGYIR